MDTAPVRSVLRVAKRRLSVLVLCFCVLLLGCTPASDTYPTLVNQGMLALSTNNPYLGANLFVAAELERSRYLFNFFKNRGAPVAIEILQPRLSSTRLLMYYPREREVYAADLVEDDIKREWIVRGPFAIERQDFRTLARMETSMAGEPVFELHGKPFRFRFQQASAPNRVVGAVIPDVAPTPVPTVRPAPKRTIVRDTPATRSSPTAVPTPTIDIFKPLTTDQQALLLARGFARRDQNGDVLHIVKAASETLEGIVRWYAGSAVAIEQVKSVNQITEARTLVPGETIRIPFALVKEGKAMP